MRLAHGNRRGSTLIEFAIIAFALLLVILGAIELDRMVLVYTTLANSARAGLRYAIVHGADRSGAGVDGASGPGPDPAQVLTVVRNFAGAGALNTAALNIHVTYPSGSNAAGSAVQVSVTYSYDPLTRLPLGVTLGSTSEGVITF